MTTIAIRYPFLFLFRITGRLGPLFERAEYTAIGLSGHVSMLDKSVAKERKLKPLNRFERWLLKPIIEDEQKLRRECFRQAVIEVMGEDPKTDWS
ncbi:MAG: hypothetical protein HYV76_00325 [Candidatus Vogelbacteria bacterium]|nr:hypothetical protein [Candidatus Vogelbacteria bacterium]